VEGDVRVFDTCDHDPVRDLFFTNEAGVYENKRHPALRQPRGDIGEGHRL